MKNVDLLRTYRIEDGGYHAPLAALAWMVGTVTQYAPQPPKDDADAVRRWVDELRARGVPIRQFDSPIPAVELSLGNGAILKVLFGPRPLLKPTQRLCYLQLKGGPDRIRCVGQLKLKWSQHANPTEDVREEPLEFFLS